MGPASGGSVIGPLLRSRGGPKGGGVGAQKGTFHPTATLRCLLAFCLSFPTGRRGEVEGNMAQRSGIPGPSSSQQMADKSPAHGHPPGEEHPLKESGAQAPQHSEALGPPAQGPAAQDLGWAPVCAPPGSKAVPGGAEGTGPRRWPGQPAPWEGCQQEEEPGFN